MGVDCVKANNDKIAREALEPEPQYLDQFKKNRAGPDNNLQIVTDQKVTTINTKEQHLYCLICKEKYAREERQPVLICQEDHTICSVCKDMLLATKVERYKICPFCKRLLRGDEVRVNQSLLALIK